MAHRHGAPAWRTGMAHRPSGVWLPSANPQYASGVADATYGAKWYTLKWHTFWYASCWNECQQRCATQAARIDDACPDSAGRKEPRPHGV